MTQILKPFGRGRVLTEEEVVAQLEGYVDPVVDDNSENIVVQPTDIVTPENLREIVDFHGNELVRSEYDALTKIAQTYFSESAEKYFSNLIDWNYKVYLRIDSQYVTRLDLNNQNLPKIPVEVGELIQLQILHLSGNHISKIENLDGLIELKELHFGNNSINYDSPHNEQELQKLEDRNVTVYKR